MSRQHSPCRSCGKPIAVEPGNHRDHCVAAHWDEGIEDIKLWRADRMRMAGQDRASTRHDADGEE